MPKPEGVIETKLGKMRYVLTDAKHVYLSTDYGRGDDFCLTVRRVQYSVSIHLYDDEAGWGVRAHHDLYVRRKDTRDCGSSAADRDIKAAVIEAWKVSVTPEMRHEAEVDALASRIETQDEKVKRLREELLEEEKALGALLVQRNELTANPVR